MILHSLQKRKIQHKYACTYPYDDTAKHKDYNRHAHMELNLSADFFWNGISFRILRSFSNLNKKMSKSKHMLDFFWNGISFRILRSFSNLNKKLSKSKHMLVTKIWYFSIRNE